MTDLLLIAAGEWVNFIWIVIFVLIGLVGFVKGLIERLVTQKKSGEPRPPLSETIRQELKRVMSETSGKRRRKTEKPEEPVPTPAREPAPVTVAVAPPPSTVASIYVPRRLRKRPARDVTSRVKSGRSGRSRSGSVAAIGGRSKRALRRAIVAREILGPPLSLRKSCDIQGIL